ncbi:YibE/F family protein [Pseudonocardia sp. S2-4]|uniref:YibE/F family protein n=2 Tax=Pseudonocardia humida TaxID=2800819 RepID=A0ABT1A7M5_9PSEU|nr:YibE/F family protein [Pseudonocardia humida]
MDDPGYRSDARPGGPPDDPGRRRRPSAPAGRAATGRHGSAGPPGPGGPHSGGYPAPGRAGARGWSPDADAPPTDPIGVPAVAPVRAGERTAGAAPSATATGTQRTRAQERALREAAEAAEAATRAPGTTAEDAADEPAAAPDSDVATTAAPTPRKTGGTTATRATRGSGRAARPAPPEVGHGHGHGHSPAAPAGRRVRILIAALLVPCAIAALAGVVLLWPGSPPEPSSALSQQPVRATVTQTAASDCSPGSGDGACLTLLLAMADGPMPGRDLVQVVPVEPSTPRFAVGDEVVLGYSGGDPNDPGSYQVVDFQRGTPLIWLAALFAAAVLVLGRWRGLAALAALALTFAVLLLFVLPAILSGSDPLAVAVVGSGLIMFAVLYLTHGPSARTSVAVLGTLLSLAVIGALGTLFAALASLTGLDDQTANLIASLGTGVDARGLLLAGVVIGALGVLDDVTVTQTSAVWELRRANPGLGAPALFGAAMRIGRDHVSSAVNTLVLAYAGASLPLMLLFSLSGRNLGDVVTSQDVATEIVRTLVGSIGLVASVPITTGLAAVVASREELTPA